MIFLVFYGVKILLWRTGEYIGLFWAIISPLFIHPLWGWG
jgi:hypothetical protein